MSREIRLIRVAVGILQRDNKVLVAKRPGDKPYSGFWEFPGGKIEENESAGDALRRELLEELGINVVTAEPWFEHVHAYPDKTVLLEMWRVTSFSGEPHGNENQALLWVTLPEMTQLRLLEGNWPIIDKMKTLF
jgi:8-oxo-dGTP diphosphatase